jgi:hypothetical protein
MIRRGPVRSVVVLLVTGLTSLAARSPANESQADSRPAGSTRASQHDQAKALETESDFQFWKQKALLEIEILHAQIEAKQAEIKQREAANQIRRLERDLAVVAKLEEPISMSFANETPLEDVLKYIKSATMGPHDTGIPIYVDPEGLSKAKKTMVSPVSLDLEQIPLRTTLRLLLKQLGLTYTVRDGLLMITNEP